MDRDQEGSNFLAKADSWAHYEYKRLLTLHYFHWFAEATFISGVCSWSIAFSSLF